MLLQITLIGLAAFILVSILREIFHPGLADIPGPFFAKFTSLWRLYTTWQRTFQYDIPRLHRKYNSTLIRLSPDMVSCTDPRVIDRAFGFHNEMQKVYEYSYVHLARLILTDYCSLTWSSPLCRSSKVRNSKPCLLQQITRRTLDYGDPSPALSL